MSNEDEFVGFYMTLIRDLLLKENISLESAYGEEILEKERKYASTEYFKRLKSFKSVPVEEDDSDYLIRYFTDERVIERINHYNLGKNYCSVEEFRYLYAEQLKFLLKRDNYADTNYRYILEKEKYLSERKYQEKMTGNQYSELNIVQSVFAREKAISELLSGFRERESFEYRYYQKVL